MASEEESPTQIQQRNIREAEMLTSNLGEGGISQQEILSDVGVLKELAILQESMVSTILKSRKIKCVSLKMFCRNGFHVVYLNLQMIYEHQ